MSKFEKIVLVAITFSLGAIAFPLLSELHFGWQYTSLFAALVLLGVVYSKKLAIGEVIGLSTASIIVGFIFSPTLMNMQIALPYLVGIAAVTLLVGLSNRPARQQQK